VKPAKTLCQLAISVIVAVMPPVHSHEAESDCNDTGLTVDTLKFSDHVILVANLTRLSEATFDLNCAAIENMEPSRALPCKFNIATAGTTELLRLNVVPKAGGFHYSYGPMTWHWHWGVPNNQSADDYSYRLPYNSQESHRVLQGYFGSYSHQKGTFDEYAIDFDMHKGTKVLAARAGVVVAYRDDSDRGGSDSKYIPCANYVIIKHCDGTYGQYEHLRRNGVLVALGDHVEEGQSIGLSGATGHVDVPHLHFAVVQITDTHSGSIPFKMRTRYGVMPQLDRGEDY
jgi:Peptidase family M23